MEQNREKFEELEDLWSDYKVYEKIDETEKS